jgi:hypothetical protein
MESGFAVALFLLSGLAVPGLAQNAGLGDFPAFKPTLTSRAPAGAGPDFLAGVNYPWYNYGSDFGANGWGHMGVSSGPVRAAVSTDFDFLKSKGVRVVRWFVFCDGRASLKFDGGLVTGVNPVFYDDMDAALDIAQTHGIKLILVLFDYHMADDAKTYPGGVQTGGRSNLINDAKAQDSLLTNALEPILKKYGGNSTVLAWEAVNEPEMAVRSLMHLGRSVSSDSMHAFVKRVVGAIHAGGGKATVGSFRRGDVAQWKDADLDLYQYHYYDYMEWTFGEDLSAPYASLKLDKPCILGEFPTKGSKRGVDTFMGTAQADGLVGALGWSLRAADSNSDFRSAADVFAAWVNGR